MDTFPSQSIYGHIHEFCRPEKIVQLGRSRRPAGASDGTRNPGRNARNGWHSKRFCDVMMRLGDHGRAPPTNYKCAS